MSNSLPPDDTDNGEIDISTVNVIEHIMIRDVVTGEILLNKRDVDPRPMDISAERADADEE